MEPQTRRRQYRACDRCRQSKRRCILLDGAAEDSERCRNCVKLNYTCTFNFASSRETRQRRSRQQHPSTAASVEDSSYAASVDAASPRSAFGYVWDIPAIMVPEGTDAEPTSWPLTPSTLAPYHELSRDIASLCRSSFGTMEGPLGSQSRTWPVEAPSADETAVGQSRLGCIGGTWNAPMHVPQATMSLSQRSPVALLNSTLTRTLANKYFGSIFDSMMTALAFRYLGQRTNGFAGPYCYEITSDKQIEDSVMIRNHISSQYVHPETGHVAVGWPSAAIAPMTIGTPVSDMFSSLDNALETDTTRSDGHNVTLIGIARFLDNFEAFYGNSRPRKARDQDEAVLRTAVYAFALQHAPIVNTNANHTTVDSSNTELFTPGSNSQLLKHAWYRTRSELIASKVNCSFVRIYAVFVFHLLPIPEGNEAVLQSDDGPVELLNHALCQMTELLAQVETYLDCLGLGSLHQALMDACVRIVKWHGYLRDTLASLLSNRPCVLADIPWTPPGKLRCQSMRLMLLIATCRLHGDSVDIAGHSNI